MMGLLRRTIPVLLASMTGLVLIAAFYSPTPTLQFIQNQSLEYYQIIRSVALLLGMWVLCHSHWVKIRRRQAGWGYSGVMFASLGITMILAFWNEPAALWRDIRQPDQRQALLANLGGYTTVGESNDYYNWVYEYIYRPIDSTIFSILAFYIASAAFRTFRARTTEAGLLLLAAIVVMLGRVPIGGWISAHTPLDLAAITEWIMSGPNLAAKRAILLGIALGTVTTSLRIIFGIERTYLGGSEG